MGQKIKRILKKLVIPLLFVSIIFGSFGFVGVPHANAAMCWTPSACAKALVASGVGTVLNVIGVAVFTLTSWVLGAFGFVLEIAVEFTVVKMGENIKAIPAVALGWTVFRDLSNMAFIFVLLFSAIATILQMDSYGAKRLLPKLVIVALLLNFSFFFTGIVIDASNIVATGFTGNIKCVPADAPPDTPASEDCSMATAVMEALKLQTISKPEAATDLSQLFLIFIFTILGSGFMLVTAFIFLIISALLVTRFVVLIFILILSPIAFVSMIIPGAGITNTWRSTLISQALFAPAFFVLMWFVLSVISSDAFRGSVGGESFATAFNANATLSSSVMKIVFNFVIVTVFECAALMIAKSMASKGPGAVSKLTGFATKTAGAAVLGTAAFSMRNTVGRFANSGAVQRKLARIPLVGGVATAGVDKIAKSSFDIRSQLGNEYGKVRTGGFAAQEKSSQARKERTAEVLKDRGYTDKRALDAAEEKESRALDKEHAKPAAEQRQNIADRDKREEDIATKDDEIADAMRDLADALNKKEEATKAGNALALANAVSLEQRARQKQSNATQARQRLVAGRDEVRLAEMEVEAAGKEKISGREHFARKMDAAADRFGGKKNIIGRIYANTLGTQHAKKTAKAIRASERKDVNEDNREEKRILESQKRSLAGENAGLGAELKILEGVKKYGTGANMVAEQARLITQQQALTTQIDEAINIRRDSLLAGRLQQNLKKLEDEGLKPIAEYLARFGGAADFNKELTSREARYAANEAALKKIDEKIENVGAPSEDMRSLFEEYRSTSGGTPPPTP